MDDQFEPHTADTDSTPMDDSSAPWAVDVPTTGVEAVDQVLSKVAALGNTPVGEHVAVFEQAHEQLRRALDATPGE